MESASQDELESKIDKPIERRVQGAAHPDRRVFWRDAHLEWTATRVRGRERQRP